MRNIQELKVMLLAMHQKDVKQTTLAFFMAEFIMVLAVFLVTMLVYGEGTLPSVWGWLLIGGLIILPSVPYLVKLYGSVMRPAQIIHFTDLLERGAVVDGYIIFTKYKLRLPGIRLFPALFTNITIGNGSQIFTFPLSAVYLSSFKNLISEEVSTVNGFSGISWSSN
ncbi:hypothetical protein [Chitinophaga sp. CB10]|uniref:hypothetical protein n=1 Tax=Chitinophaga sp. CB10 TaxID=1891659 RepID=UPI0025B7AC22|nr:hypothetical protein [Chitinophaga sp. CB10]